MKKKERVMRKSGMGFIVFLFATLAIVTNSFADEFHDIHLTAVYGPQLGTACATCHNQHGMNLVIPESCDPCHSPGGTYDGVNDSVIGAWANLETGVYEQVYDPVAGNMIVFQAGKERWCVTCHDDVPSVVNGVSAPNVVGDDTDYGYYITGHGKHGDQQAITCLACHDPASIHADGEPRTYARTISHTESPYTDTITGLTAGATYDIRMTYSDADGINGTGTNPQIVTVVMSGDNNMTTVGTATAVMADLTSIAVSMPYTDDYNGNNTYTVEYKLSSSGTWLYWGTNNYQAGYRLKSVDGQAPMDIPRTIGSTTSDDFVLCFSCHDSTPFMTMDNTDTNFRSDVDKNCVPRDPSSSKINQHWYHLQLNNAFYRWDSDSDSDGKIDSIISCTACHNVHGPRLKDGPDISHVPAMIRTGELIGRESALNLDYLINSCPDHQTRSATNELSDSTGGAMKFQGPGRGSVAKNGVCLMCHNEYKPYWREPKEIISCSNCHNSGSHAAHLGVAYDPQACEACHDLTNVPYFKSGTDSNGDSNIDLSETDVCDICHQDPSNATGFKEGWYNPGFELDCNDCHELPPSTGTHLAHYNGTDDSLVYGDLRTTEDFTGGQVSSINMIGCGNCHPMDPAFHGNGTWGDVKLSNSAAPAGTLKALSASGSYEQTTGTCSNVYCHSANSWATDGDVPMPWPPLTVWDPASDPLPRPLPDNIITARVYKDVTWNSGETLTCSGCHDNPPQTFAANNDGGAGDSHYWVDEYGYENLHVYNMGYYPPIDCRTCHYNTVQDPSSWVFDSSIGRRRYYDVDLYDKAKHVNGSADIAFDTVNNYTYSSDYSGSKTYDLSVASFDPATKTCSNVGCHKTETEVIWGVPYRWYGPTAECNRCHGY
jgi:predicted CxxxxCH...CXXCH cytochrome family protein